MIWSSTAEWSALAQFLECLEPYTQAVKTSITAYTKQTDYPFPTCHSRIYAAFAVCSEKIKCKVLYKVLYAGKQVAGKHTEFINLSHSKFCITHHIGVEGLFQNLW